VSQRRQLCSIEAGVAEQAHTGADGGDSRITIRQIIENSEENSQKLLEHYDQDDEAATS
jgi:hypothetical protein